MPDTKSGRERKGRNKRAQLEHHLARREVRTLDVDDEPEIYDEVEELDEDVLNLYASNGRNQ
ncbi:hypothetical protein AUR64_06020 [Haloprofundus marisrubri]|uniref:Uncharacterized protein n=1 Tax=Haloprofundus marisrubri TaxID=1514971 RepID=A0A0W1RCE8_9EURY|nr:hypothetical protein [Haloprofundus marisrubri]KTG11046.1 hypothetical protein AUR64_06020 [Haloprofundus marisrubri]